MLHQLKLGNSVNKRDYLFCMKVLIDEKWLRVLKEDVEFPNGVKIKDFYTVERPTYSAVVPFISPSALLLVKQYRHGPKEDILNIPMGVIDEGESPLESAQRELEEETGYTAQKMISAGVFENAPSFLRLKCYLFIALDLTKVSTKNNDSDELTETIIISIERALKMISSGEIKDMTTAIGIFTAFLSQINKLDKPKS